MGVLKSIDAVRAWDPTLFDQEDNVPGALPSTIFDRNVHGIFGIPIDIIDLKSVVDRLRDAAARKRPYHLSTPNLNFLMLSHSDPEFRETVLSSELCPADGMPIVWLARAMGVPLCTRIAGSDIFEEFKIQRDRQPLRVFFFGGDESVVGLVAKRISAECQGMVCVGSIAPGYGSVEQMSLPTFFDQINASNADLVAVFLSATKGQRWLAKNAHRIRVPLRAQLGATINYQAGRVRRAPKFLRSAGLEWLWRIKEEPFLWRRYARDGIGLLWLMLSSVLPLIVLDHLRSRAETGLSIEIRSEGKDLLVRLAGVAASDNVDALEARLAPALNLGANIVMDISDISHIDTRFLGFLLVLRKFLSERGLTLNIACTSRRVARLFRLHRFRYMLDVDAGLQSTAK